MKSLLFILLSCLISYNISYANEEIEVSSNFDDGRYYGDSNSYWDEDNTNEYYVDNIQVSDDEQQNCQPPDAGNWTIIEECFIDSNVNTPENVVVTNGASLTIRPSGILTVDFKEHHIFIQNNGKVYVEDGGMIMSSHPKGEPN